MIKYLKNHEIDKEQWDNCISASRASKPYAYSWYLDIIAPGWEALIDDDYNSVFPIPRFKKFGIRYIATPIFLQQLGAFSPDKPASVMIHEFVDYMPEFYWFVDLCVGQKVYNDGFRVSERPNYELDLSKPYDYLWENFLPVCQRNIKTAIKKKTELCYDISPDELINLFRQNRGKEIKGIRDSDYIKLKNLMLFCIQSNKGRIIGVRSFAKVLIFGIFIVEMPGRITVLFISGSPESRKRMTAYYLINEIIQENSRAKKKLDFAGSAVPGVASFMESFGCINFSYYRIYRNKLPWPARMVK
jgi:hypothetical protein